jgi:hypothetical protein
MVCIQQMMAFCPFFTSNSIFGLDISTWRHAGFTANLGDGWSLDLEAWGNMLRRRNCQDQKRHLEMQHMENPKERKRDKDGFYVNHY